MRLILFFICLVAEGEASLAREDLEKQLRSLKQRLSREAELRAKEAKDFADRLKEVRAPACRLSRDRRLRRRLRPNLRHPFDLKLALRVAELIKVFPGGRKCSHLGCLHVRTGPYLSLPSMSSRYSADLVWNNGIRVR